MATHSSVLAWRIPWREGLGGIQSMGCKESDTMKQLTDTHTHTSLFVTLWTVDCQASLPMVFSRQEYWRVLPCPPPGVLPNLGIEPSSPTLQADSLPAETQEALNKQKDSIYTHMGISFVNKLKGVFLTV